jgi:uncharacterized membrane protein YozB (DUF420 family)
MSATVLHTAHRDQRVSSRGTAIVLLAAAAAALVFLAVAALPYFLSAEYGSATYAGRRAWLLVHIAGGAVALLTGPLQLWLGLTDLAMERHRLVGFGYITAVAVSSIAAFYLAVHTEAGFAFGAGLVGLAVAWTLTTGLAFLAIRRGLVEQHKEWMTRSYVVTFAFVFFRMTLPALEAIDAGTPADQLAVASWGCWTVPLLITETIMQGRKILAA